MALVKGVPQGRVRGPDSAPSADVNECLNSEICSPSGECLNSHGSYFCSCAPGFSNTAGGVSCQGELEDGSDIPLVLPSVPSPAVRSGLMILA